MPTPISSRGLRHPARGQRGRWPAAHFCGLFAAALLLLALLTAEVAPPPSHEGAFSRYAVAAGHPAASAAGAEVLAAGGTAADAAAATMLALGVVRPSGSGLGGGGFALYYDASEREVTFLDFRETAPGRASRTMFQQREGESDEVARNRSREGGLAVAVPGEPAGIDLLIERYGSDQVSRETIFAPAIRLATRGFEAVHDLERFSRWLSAPMRQDRVMGRWFPRGSEVIPTGHRMTNPEQARTLRRFAAGGARVFYRGAVGREILREVQRRGGILSREDLAAYRPTLRTPLSAEHFGKRWVTAPPPSAGGYTILSSLAQLERTLPRRLVDADSAHFRHALAESFKGPYLDRHHFIGDPDFVDVPVDAMLADARTAARTARFHPALAQPTARFEVPLPGRAAPALGRPGSDAGTTHFCVVDAEGNVASVTSTVNLPFGARFTAAGIVMNNEMDDFAREIGKPNAFGLVGGAPNLPGPHHRPVSSMSPTIVFDARQRPVLCVGGAGGSRIPTASEQVALFVLRFGDSPGQAIVRARLHHQGDPAQLVVEKTMRPELRAKLEARGHRLREVDHSATVQTIQIVHEESGRRLVAAADTRRGSQPAGR